MQKAKDWIILTLLRENWWKSCCSSSFIDVRPCFWWLIGVKRYVFFFTNISCTRLSDSRMQILPDIRFWPQTPMGKGFLEIISPYISQFFIFPSNCSENAAKWKNGL
jgi:hypothetical protein